MNKNGTEKPVLQAERIRLPGAASFLSSSLRFVASFGWIAVETTIISSGWESWAIMIGR